MGVCTNDILKNCGSQTTLATNDFHLKDTKPEKNSQKIFFCESHTSVTYRWLTQRKDQLITNE